MPQHPTVLLRTSSKRAFEEFTEKDESVTKDLWKQIKRSRGILKSKLSPDEPFSAESGRLYELEAEHTRLRYKRSQSQFFKEKEQIEENADSAAWDETDEARTLREKESALSLNAKIFRKQAEATKVEEGNLEQIQQRHFMQLYTSSSKGFNVPQQLSGMGKRDTSQQSNFRAALEKAYNSIHPNPSAKSVWCPISREYLDTKLTHAAHIFPYAHGQLAMDSIFTRENHGQPELMSIHNGMLISETAEKRIDSGNILIVPDVEDDSSKQQIDAWVRSEPKGYKIRVLNPNAKGMNDFHPGGMRTEETWNDLDGKQLEFKSNFRPRARYLYWQYVVTMVRKAHAAQGGGQRETAGKELGKRFWGTHGRYMRRGNLRGLANELGHDYEHLLEDAMEPQTPADDQPNPTLVVAANNTIIANLRPKNPEDDDDGNEEDSDEEDDSDDEDDKDYH